tara:strand:+ start:2024 stop:2164 length:141 start_codon:yes stop_codon:yes gene_type:complete
VDTLLQQPRQTQAWRGFGLLAQKHSRGFSRKMPATGTCRGGGTLFR